MKILQSASNKISINILVARYGGGHYAMYEALSSIIGQQQDWKLSITDVGELVNVLTEKNKFFNIYKLFGTTNDEFYNWILQHGWTWIHPLLLIINRILIKLNYRAGVELFTEYWRRQPCDLVVSTLPLYNQAMWESLQQAKPGKPLVVIPLDYADTPPGFYLEPKTDNYIVCPSEKFVQQARSLGVKPQRILKTSGVVVHPRFYQYNCQLNPDSLANRARERQRLGLDPNLVTGVVLFGGYGSQAMLEIARRLEHFEQLQLIFLCGRNQKLADALKNSKGKQKRLVTTFTTDIPYYMHLADFFIGKAGGSSLTEAMVMNLPAIVERNHRTLINEKHNIDWMVQQEVGLVVSSFREVDRAVKQFLDPETLARYRNRVAALNNQAVFEVADWLEQIIATRYQSPVAESTVEKI